MSCGSWGVELWDQGDNTLKYCNEQLVASDVYFQLVSEIQKLQLDFGKQLRKAVNRFERKIPSASDDSTYTTSFCRLLQNLSTMGALFEASSKELADDVAAGFKQLNDNERKAFEGRRNAYSLLTQSLEQSRKQLELTWQKYVTAFKDKQKAYDNWARGQKDLPPPRVAQLKDLYNQKIHAFDQLKTQYASELNRYNSSLRQHYNKSMMDFLEEFSLGTRIRIDKTKALLDKMTSIYEHTCSNLSECVRSMKTVVAAIDSAKDDEVAIQRFKSGDLPPVDLPFLDLEHCPSYALEGTNHTLGAFMLGIEPSQPCGQLPGGGKPSNAKRGSTKGSREDVVTLRSPFICDFSLRSVKDTDFTIIQLSDRIHDLTEQIKRTESEVEGTQRLLNAYRENPSLGCPDTVEPKVGMLKRRLLSLQEQVNQLKNRYQQLGGEQALRDAQVLLLKLQSSASESSKRAGHAATTGVESDNSFDSAESDEEFDHPSSVPPPPPVVNTENYLGEAVMKYPFEGDGAQCLAAQPGDSFYVTELDTEGTMWTSVVSKDGSRRGLVPTAYIDVTKY